MIRLADLSVQRKLMVSLQGERSTRSRGHFDMMVIRRLPEAFG